MNVCSLGYCIVVLLSTSVTLAHAEFALNFLPSSAPINVFITCMPGVSYSADSCVRGTSSPDPDTSPFYMEMAVDNTTGYYYYHVLLGDPGGDFSQEYYIGISGGTWYGSAYPANASAGALNGGADATPYPLATFYDPLGPDYTKSGNASARPDRTLFKQTISGVDFNQTAVKAFELKQPLITQQINAADVVAHFSIDMSAHDYFVMSPTPAVINNTLLVIDALTGQAVSNFSSTTDSQKEYVTGGLLIYHFGGGASGSDGTYTYSSGVFDVRAVDWKAYSDPFNVP